MVPSKRDAAHFQSFIGWLLAPIALWSICFAALILWCGPLTGDLTRVGRWPDRAYATRVPQKSIAVRPHGQPELTRATVFVHGDSFSAGNLWQSVFEEISGLQTITFHHQQVGCLENWVRWVERQRRSDGVVILEVIERDFMYRFASLEPCGESEPRIAGSIQGVFAPDVWRPGYDHLPVDALYAFRAAWNTVLTATGRDRVLHNNVVNVAMRESRLFSYAASGRLLYTAEDHSKGRWTEREIVQAFANLDAIRQRVEAVGMRLLLIIVPDKSSVYRRYVAEPLRVAPPPQSFDDAVTLRAQVVLNLMPIFESVIARTPDMYLPNDTHIGSIGYRLMGESIAEVLTPAAASLARASGEPR